MRRLSARSVKRMVQINQCWRSRGQSGQVVTIRNVYRHEGRAHVIVWRDATGEPVPRSQMLTFMELGRDFNLVIDSKGNRYERAAT